MEAASILTKEGYNMFKTQYYATTRFSRNDDNNVIIIRDDSDKLSYHFQNNMSRCSCPISIGKGSQCRHSIFLLNSFKYHCS